MGVVAQIIQEIEPIAVTGFCVASLGGGGRQLLENLCDSTAPGYCVTDVDVTGMPDVHQEYAHSFGSDGLPPQSWAGRSLRMVRPVDLRVKCTRSRVPSSSLLVWRVAHP